MAYTKSIIFTFSTFWKTTNSVQLSICVKNVFSARKNFMPVGLVAHIPNQNIIGGIENVMKRNGKFNNAKTGAQMPFFCGDNIDDEFTKVLLNQRQFSFRNFQTVYGRSNCI